jgi:hypothetical protein
MIACRRGERKGSGSCKRVTMENPRDPGPRSGHIARAVKRVRDARERATQALGVYFKVMGWSSLACAALPSRASHLHCSAEALCTLHEAATSRGHGPNGTAASGASVVGRNYLAFLL